MRTQIFISGQPQSIFTIMGKLGENSEKSGYGYKAIFKTKKQATKALSKVFQGLRTEIIDHQGTINLSSLLTYKRGDYLSYDAARATISEY